MSHTLAPFFSPRSIAVVGAADDATKLRGRILSQLLKGEFAGPVYPVHPSATTIQGLPAYRAIGATPAPADLALVAIPSDGVPGVLEECATAGVKAVMLYSGGFAEEGEGKRGLQDEVAAIARRTGMRIAGPNSVGFLNVAGSVCCTFSPAIDFAALPAQRASTGKRIGIVSQSGGLGFAIFNRGLKRHLAFSHVVNTGNEADIDATEILDFLIDDPSTGVVAMFLESIRRGRRFIAVAERALAAGKPIVLAKVGRSEAGTRAALSHTASMTGADAVYDSVFRRLGIARVDDQDAMLDVAQAFALCPTLAGKRIGVVTISGGVGGWMSDTLSGQGFTLPVLDAPTQARLRAFLPSFAATFNPIDITANATGTDYRASCLETLIDIPEVDGIVNISSLANDTMLAKERERLAALAARRAKPIVFYTYPLPGPGAGETLADIGIPLYTSLAGTGRALTALADLHAARAATHRPPDVSGDRARAVAALDAAGGALCEYEAAPLLAAYGIAGPAARLATTRAEAEAAAKALGLPVALKVQSPSILHKTEAGGVALRIADVRAAGDAFDRIAAATAAAGDIRGVLVQTMAPAGVEMIVGAIDDPAFGPQVTVGLGGVLVELMRDVAMAPAPLDHGAALALIARLRGAALLDGWRGAPAADRTALAGLIVRLSVLAADFAGRIAEVELNPVIVHPAGQGVSVVDALVRQQRPEAAP